MDIKIKLKPFRVPNFVLVDADRVGQRQDGFNPDNNGMKFELSQLDEDTLDELCEQFRADVFQKAGKVDPELKKYMV